MKYVVVALTLVFAGCGMFSKKPEIANNCNFTSAEAKKVAAADVKCAVKQMRPAMKTCFDEEVARNSGFEATQSIKFEITNDGEAKNVTWEPDPGSSDLKSCAAGVFDAAPFPSHKAKKSAKARFPFKFKKTAAVAPAPAPAPEAAPSPEAAPEQSIPEMPEETFPDEAPPAG